MPVKSLKLQIISELENGETAITVLGPVAGMILGVAEEVGPGAFRPSSYYGVVPGSQLAAIPAYAAAIAVASEHMNVSAQFEAAAFAREILEPGHSRPLVMREDGEWEGVELFEMDEGPRGEGDL